MNNQFSYLGEIKAKWWNSASSIPLILRAGLRHPPSWWAVPQQWPSPSWSHQRFFFDLSQTKNLQRLSLTHTHIGCRLLKGEVVLSRRTEKKREEKGNLYCFPTLGKGICKWQEIRLDKLLLLGWKTLISMETWPIARQYKKVLCMKQGYWSNLFF